MRWMPGILETQGREQCRMDRGALGKKSNGHKKSDHICDNASETLGDEKYEAEASF